MAPSPPSRPRGVLFILVLIAALITAVVAWTLQFEDVLTEDELRGLVTTRLQTEAAEGFVVTGRLSSTLTGSSARRWRLRILNLETGRAEVTVRVPAEMTYGFSLDGFDADAIRFGDNGIVEVVVPPLEVFSVEPTLEEADVEIDLSGQARLTPAMTEQTVEQTLHRVRPALREQAEAHLRDSNQPAVNSARALRRVLSAPLEAAGVNLGDVRFRFVVAPGDTLDLSSTGSRRTVPAE